MLEGLVIKQQCCYVLKHYSCQHSKQTIALLDQTKQTNTDSWKINKIIIKILPNKKKKRKNKEPGFGKWGTTLMASDMAWSLGSPLSPFSAANIFFSGFLSRSLQTSFFWVEILFKLQTLQWLYKSLGFCCLGPSLSSFALIKWGFGFWVLGFGIFPPKTDLKAQIFLCVVLGSVRERERERVIAC